MKYELTAPMIITSRLFPGVKVGDATISVLPVTYDGERYSVSVFIDTPDEMLYSDSGDLSIVLVDDETEADLPRKAIEALLSFLSADGDSYRRTMDGYQPPADGWIFSAKVAEWSYENSGDISMLAVEFGEI